MKMLQLPEFSRKIITLNIGTQDHNRRFKIILEIGLTKGVLVSFSPTRLIIFLLHADWQNSWFKILANQVMEDRDD